MRILLNQKNEPGGTAPPAETRAGSERKSFTADSVAALLSSEFAAESGEDAPEEKETPSEGEATPAEIEQVPGEEAGTEEGPAETEESEAPPAEGEERPDAETEAGDDTKGLTEQEKADLAAYEAAGDEGELPKSLQKLVSKRIAKLVTARDEAKKLADSVAAERDRLATEVEQLKADPKRPAHLAPASVLDEKGLDQLDQTSRSFLNDAENYLDETASEEERGRVERYMAKNGMNAKQLARNVREIREWRAAELPRQRANVAQFRTTETKATTEAKKYFPRLDDKSTPEYKRAEEVTRLVPELKSRTPAHRMAAAAYVMGLQVFDYLKANGVEGDMFGHLDAALKAKFPAKGKAAPAARRAPPKPPTGGAAAPATRRTAANGEERSEQFRKAPTRENAVEMARAALRG